ANENNTNRPVSITGFNCHFTHCHEHYNSLIVQVTFISKRHCVDWHGDFTGVKRKLTSTTPVEDHTTKWIRPFRKGGKSLYAWTERSRICVWERNIGPTVVM